MTPISITKCLVIDYWVLEFIWLLYLVIGYLNDENLVIDVMKKLIKEFTKGIMTENPTFGLVLGLCPTLAVSTSVRNALGMGLAATFVWSAPIL